MAQAAKQTEPKRKNVADVPDEFLDCRDLGHAWARPRVVEDKKFRHYTRLVVCSRCATERIQVISLAGMLVATSYRYATGYLLNGAGGLTVDDRAKMRLRNLKRFL